MALTLRADITATQTTIDVNGTDAITDGDVFAVDSEYLLILGTPTPDPRRSWQRLSVVRGTGGSTKASHLAAATLTAANAFAGGGGAIAVTDGTTTVEDVTTLELAGGIVTDEGAGVAGVAVSMRLLGPFEFTYQTPGILGDPFTDVPFIAGVELTEGQIVTDVLIARTSEWIPAPDGAEEVHLWIGATTDPVAFENWTDFYHCSLETAIVALQPEPWTLPVTLSGFSETGGPLRMLPVRCIDTTHIGVYVTDETSTGLPGLSGGSVQIWLVTMSPS